ncbi:hypothetical protein K3495_g1247 [Podosphaera aphanis]|nr:hypothetical protein K3495_g1247 [Podosphaera aphanis]
MADYDDGESFYGDDDFDQLPQDALIELENDAIQYTQARTQARLQGDYGDDTRDQDRNEVITIYADENDDVVQNNINKTLATRVPSRGLENGQQLQNLISPCNDPSQRPITIHDPLIQSQNNQQLNNDCRITSLHKQIEELINERDTLKVELSVKAGEIAIVRAKNEKINQEYERQLTAIQNQNNEQLEQKQKALEAARLAEKNTAIERDFIKRDLAEESERVRQLSRKEREKKNSASVNTTPRKEKKSLPFRDGFDDDKVQALSPSKQQSSSKFHKNPIVSPTKPAWRKRKYIEPVAIDALEPLNENVPLQLAHKLTVLDDESLKLLTKQDERFEFLGSMLDHSFDEKHLRTIQEMGKYSLPSRPNETFQALILTKVPDLGARKCIEKFPIEFCEFLISLWTNCIEEKYYQPVYLFIDLLTLALEIKTTTIVPSIINSLLPILQRTADLVAIPRFQSLSTDKYDKHINLTACMNLLYLASLGCMSKPLHNTEFWKLMRWDFVLLMLSTNQFKADYDLMLQLLSTSVMSNSLGALSGDDKQDRQAGWIIDRLTYPLNEHPCKPMSTERFEKKDLNHIRLQILRLMTSITRSPYASKVLADHPQAIGRLICLISDELDVLYDFESRYQESAKIINIGTRLLHHLIIKHESVVDVQQKLSNIHGGSQKYLLSLSRLHFAEEDLVMESKIDPDIAGFALELLELVVTPEEGDAIQLAFPN